MAEEHISKERVEAIIAAYGADPERWPEAERAGALALLEEFREGLDQLQGAAELDRLLGGLTQPQPTNMIKAKLLDGASQAMISGGGQRKSVERGVTPGWIESFTAMIFETVSLRPLALGGIMAPVLALGIWLGAALTAEPLDDEELFAAFGEDYELWTDSELPDPSNMTGDT